jgi:hypothetical protein
MLITSKISLVEPFLQDFWNPNSVNKDPLFPNNKIADHEVGYPGLKLFVVSDQTFLRQSALSSSK